MISQQTPFFTNCCEHPKKSYVGSVTVLHSPIRSERFDIYFFAGFKMTEVCVRYGNEPHEYCSPGNLVDVIRSSNYIPHYKAIVDLLIERGKLSFTFNEPSK